MHSFEAFAEHGASAVKAGFDNAGIEIEDVGGGFGGKIFEIAEHDDSTVFFGQIVDQAGEEAAQFVVVDGIVGRGSAGGDEILPVAGNGFEGKIGTESQGGVAVTGDAGVAGDTEDPGFDVFRLAELVEVFADFEEGFLGDFFGFFAAAAIEIAVLKDFAAEGGKKRIESIGLTREHVAGHELERFHS